MASSGYDEEGISDQAAYGILRDLKNRKFCDIELVCQGTRIPVHKVVICTQSKVFSSAFTCSYFQAESNSYNVLDTDPQTVERMVEYLYTGEYSYPTADEPPVKALDNNPPPSEGISNFQRALEKREGSRFWPHLDVLALADKYLLKDLTAKAIVYFRKELLDCKNMAKFFEVIPAVYALECESSGILRKECVRTTRSYFGTAMAVGKSKRQLLDDALALTPEFAKELLGTCVVRPEPSRKRRKIAA